MQRRNVNIAVAGALALWASVGLRAADPEGGQAAPSFAPVDQAFGDLDSLMTSLRQVEVGLNLNGEQTSLFRLDPLTNPSDSFGQPVLYRLGPGFRARVNRLDYLVLANPFPVGKLRKNDFGVNVAGRDGIFIEGATANTVYDLRPISIQGPDGQLDLSGLRMPDGSDAWLDLRLDSRVNRRRNLTLSYAPTATVEPRGRQGRPDAAAEPSDRLQQVWPAEVRRERNAQPAPRHPVPPRPQAPPAPTQQPAPALDAANDTPDGDSTPNQGVQEPATSELPKPESRRAVLFLSL
jgi:hypothetical protein